MKYTTTIFIILYKRNFKFIIKFLQFITTIIIVSLPTIAIGADHFQFYESKILTSVKIKTPSSNCEEIHRKRDFFKINLRSINTILYFFF